MPSCQSRCVSVSILMAQPFDVVTIFGSGIDLDYILDEFSGQGQRSTIRLNRYQTLAYGVASFNVIA